MTRKDINFKDAAARNEHYRYRLGRPTDAEIKKDIVEMAEFVGPFALPSDAFLTNDLCYFVRLRYPGQGNYIGHRVKCLTQGEDVPIKRIDTHNRRALYSIVL